MASLQRHIRKRLKEIRIKIDEDQDKQESTEQGEDVTLSSSKEEFKYPFETRVHRSSFVTISKPYNYEEGRQEVRNVLLSGTTLLSNNNHSSLRAKLKPEHSPSFEGYVVNQIPEAEDDVNELRLTPSPTLNTPPYESFVLSDEAEKKCRIFLNSKLDEAFHNALKNAELEESSIDENDFKVHKDQASSLSVRGPRHSETIVHCFDDSDIDLYLKMKFREHPPKVHNIVRRKPRHERGSSVPALDSYYGTEDMEKVGHASYFIPTLTSDEKQAIGWRDEYQYGRWKYSLPALERSLSGNTRNGIFSNKSFHSLKSHSSKLHRGAHCDDQSKSRLPWVSSHHIGDKDPDSNGVEDQKLLEEKHNKKGKLLNFFAFFLPCSSRKISKIDQDLQTLEPDENEATHRIIVTSDAPEDSNQYGSHHLEDHRKHSKSSVHRHGRGNADPEHHHHHGFFHVFHRHRPSVQSIGVVGGDISAEPSEQVLPVYRNYCESSIQLETPMPSGPNSCHLEIKTTPTVEKFYGNLGTENAQTSEIITPIIGKIPAPCHKHAKSCFKKVERHPHFEVPKSSDEVVGADDESCFCKTSSIHLTDSDLELNGAPTKLLNRSIGRYELPTLNKDDVAKIHALHPELDNCQNHTKVIDENTNTENICCDQITSTNDEAAGEFWKGGDFLTAPKTRLSHTSSKASHATSVFGNKGSSNLPTVSVNSLSLCSSGSNMSSNLCSEAIEESENLNPSLQLFGDLDLDLEFGRLVDPEIVLHDGFYLNESHPANSLAVDSSTLNQMSHKRKLSRTRSVNSQDQVEGRHEENSRGLSYQTDLENREFQKDSAHPSHGISFEMTSTEGPFTSPKST